MIRSPGRFGRKNLAALMVLGLSFLLAAAPAQAGTRTAGEVSTQEWACDPRHDYTIFSAAAGKYVAAEFGAYYTGSLYGMLRARTDSDKVGAWEKFTLCRDYATGYVAFRGYGGRWVQVEYTYPGSDDGMLRAPDSDGWPRYAEQFTIVDLEHGLVAFKSRTTGRYVSVEQAAPGLRENMLRASADTISYVEVFALR